MGFSLSGLFGGGGAGGSGGGFLDGLGSKFHDFMNGTGQELNVSTPAAINGGERIGMVQPMPTFTPTGNNTGGLLSKLSNPDARGLTFGDKLFAAGSVLQGDSGGAATYLQNQRANAQAEDDRMTQRRNQIAGANAFRNNIGPDGQMNFQGYANAMGDNLDPEKAVGLMKATRPQYQSVSTAGGGARPFNPQTGTYGQGFGGAPQLFNPDGSINQAYINGKSAEALAVAKAQREGKPLAPRAGRAGPKRGSYGENEIDWGG